MPAGSIRPVTHQAGGSQKEVCPQGLFSASSPQSASARKRMYHAMMHAATRVRLLAQVLGELSQPK